jgi:hypothetical protein
MIVYRLFYRFLFKATKLVNFVIHKELKRQIARTGKIKFHSGGCGCQSGDYSVNRAFEKSRVYVGKTMNYIKEKTEPYHISFSHFLYHCITDFFLPIDIQLV